MHRQIVVTVLASLSLALSPSPAVGAENSIVSAVGTENSVVPAVGTENSVVPAGGAENSAVPAGGYREIVVQEKPFPLSVREFAYPAARFLITDYGAKPDGSKFTGAFRKAMAACNVEGGGHVVVPKGRWTTGAPSSRCRSQLLLK